MARLGAVAVATITVLGCTRGESVQPADDRDYLYLWTASIDSTQPDFLAVLDVTEDSGRYGRLVTTLPVPGLGNVPHHTEHAMPADGQLFANDIDESILGSNLWRITPSTGSIVPLGPTASWMNDLTSCPATPAG